MKSTARNSDPPAAPQAVLPQGLRRLCESAVRKDIQAFFEDMSLYRLLRKFGSLDQSVVNASNTPRKRTRAQLLMEELTSGSRLPSSQRSSDAFAVKCCAASTRVADFTRCAVLSDQLVIVAETELKVSISPVGDIPSERARTVPSPVSVSLTSTHLVDELNGNKPRESSFSMQSVCIPGRPLQLECYTHHMIHFGLLCFAVWNAPREKADHGLLSCPSASTMHQCFPCGADDPILILGLGGNVLGRCLDHLLPPSVPIDVVEIEPSMLEMCEKHGWVPALQAPFQLLSRRSGAIIGRRYDAVQKNDDAVAYKQRSTASSRPRHSFFVMDAHDFLKGDFGCSESPTSSVVNSPRRTRDSKPNDEKGPSQTYSLIYLDCYDPAAGSMMHSATLLTLCRLRLRCGGAVVINAHISVDLHTLEQQFLGEGFDSVQVLQVAGCRQAIVVCLVALPGSTAEDVSNANLRFQVPQLRKTSILLNERMAKEEWEGCSLPFDSEWLYSSSKCGEAPRTPCRVWAHRV